MPSINLLPWREERRKNRQQVFNLRLVLSAIVGIFVLLLMWFGLNAAISNQQARNNYLKGQIALLDKQIAEIKDLQETKARLLARMQIIEQLQQSRPTEVHLFDQLVKTLPPGVYLTDVRQKGDQVEIHGVAESSARVSTYMRNIDSSDWMGDPNLQVVQKDPKVDFGARAQQFNVTAKVVDKADESKNSKSGGAQS
ncbi:MAG: PilN domain-containing protein [Gammaproteobacteria bacterium]|nr:PilN domain-containing protein [Gammaproteobacteria bacterium]MDE2346590.1 PilN domain-containing protein [Gammaproteobacteria bacterium]